MARKLDEPQARGDFFKSLGTLFAGFVAQRIEDAVTGLGPSLLRPPGALDELAFLTQCTRCDKCMRACPENAIFKAGPSAGLALGTPYIEPRSVPCYLCASLPCVAACEDAALLWPRLLEKEGPAAVRMGTARVKPDLCATWGTLEREPAPCQVCADRCPYPGEALRMEPDAEGGFPHPVVDAAFCTGCGQCVFACPVEPVAITVKPGRD
ncbi:4Fe-4S dicluster domain-containing protein [Geothrix sp. 21YS21S-4]|uniref:4Fe-4S dicluster domain-containing protein n=1 Tax=Geothrix sp. 21YS21S-4 TaxID=3068889 RepID=UPI0027BAF283|nr:4Fe-4S dicluster domain-containing protein [Geothrix sp. 21YS21S-4]